VLRSVKAGKVGEVQGYLWSACLAGLDLPVIRGLAEKCREFDIAVATRRAAMGGHTDVLDLLASEFGARIGVDCLAYAARWGQDAIIDHLVEEYGLDPNGVGEYDGRTALHWAACDGRVRTVKHLVEKHNVDIHKRTENDEENDEENDGKTALELAERNGRTECAAVLRAGD
jgi:ankyrin repeat protein